MKGHSSFSGALQPSYVESPTQRGNPFSGFLGRGGVTRVAGQHQLIAWLRGSWGLCTVAGLFALQMENYTNTSCFLYSHKCPVHSEAPRAGLANPRIQKPGQTQNWVFA